ncbi:MAG: depolymerase [Burkholderiaceae bacterium]
MKRMIAGASIVAVAVFAAGLLQRDAFAADALPTRHADPSRTSVSGLSSGAFMAVQYAVAYSSGVVGVGVVAGGPYDCAFVTTGFTTGCRSGTPSGALSLAAAQGFEALGQIDPLRGLSQMKVYLFTGTRDETVRAAVVGATRDFFAAAGVPAKHIAFVGKVPAGHAFIAPDFGNACGETAPPYVSHCAVGGHAYDQPKAILQYIHGPLKAAVTTLSSTVRPFDQTPFGSAATSLDTVGFVYVPKVCETAAGHCAVHVVFHGCRQGAQSVGSDVYKSVGYNRWADSNRLIVLYPQVVTTSLLQGNPEGCWDWWGYTGPTFAVRSGVQLSAVKAMVDRLTAP